MLVILSLAILVFAFVYYLTRKKYNFWNDRGFPTTPVSFPFGSLKGFGTKIPVVKGIQSYYENFKGKAKAVGMFFFLQPVLLITDIELVKNIYIRDFSSFHDRGFYYNKVDDPLSANLLTLEGQEWKDRRMKLTPIFTSGKMKMMFEIVDSIGEKFVNAIDKELKITTVLDMRQMLAKYSTDVIASVAFGIDSNCLDDPNSEFFKHGQRLFNLKPFELMKMLFTSAYHELSRKLHMVANPKEPCDFLLRVFTETISKREESNVQRNDFIHLLLKLKETAALGMDEMAAESFIFFSGGFETSSSALTFCLYELAYNQDIQERLRKEIQDGLDENGGKISYDLIFHYKYLDMVAKETLRKYPIIPGMLRKCTKEYKIPDSDLVIPEGNNVLIPIYSIHHDAAHYPEPEKFDPERFSPENSELRNPVTFLAFGEGPRACIGIRFGMLQVKLALVKLLTNYQINFSDKSHVPVEFIPSAPFLAPLGGMWLDLKRL